MSWMNEMVRGYVAGLKSGAQDMPECHKKESAAFRHGWSNGRDDRIGKPRDRAAVLRARAEIILRNES